MRTHTFILLAAAWLCGAATTASFAQHGAMSGASHESSLAASLDASAWDCSEWICAADAAVVTGAVQGDNERAADGAAWFVRTLANDGRVVSARWMTTALGIYDLYVNGTRVGREVLKPGFTDVLKTRRSFTYDITPLFRTRSGASNTLSVQVTPGWWADKIVTPGGSQGMYGTRCAFRGVLCLTFADGRQQLIGTDTQHWRAGVAGPVTHAAIFDGEEYDARRPMGWQAPETLGTPMRSTEFHGSIVPTDGAEVCHREDLALRPVDAYVWQGADAATAEAYGKVSIRRRYRTGEDMVVRPGEQLVVDFGQNCAAVPDFLFQAAEGTQLTCLPAELLNDSCGARSRGMDGPQGSVHRLNLRIPDSGMMVKYTFGAGKGMASYRPHCTFFGYRYVSISATSEVRIRRLLSIPVSSITREMETGTLTTGHPLVNRLIANTLWGQRSNYLSVPTDCPQRNERLGWTADTQVFAETGTFFARTDRFLRKWMHDMRDSQTPQGGFPSVSPRGQYGSGADENMRHGWSDAGVIVPWTVWKQFGDTAIIHENWAAMERYMRHVAQTRYDHQTLRRENGDYQWGDWLSYEPLESCSGSINGPDGKRLPETIVYWNFLSASYWALDADMMRDMARATGRDASQYAHMADEARTYLRREFLNSDGTFRTPLLDTMQTPLLFVLKNHLVDGQAAESVKARLRRSFADHGGCLQTGFLGTSILMSTLTAAGMTDIAYDLLFQRRNPSWLYSVDNGATTIWERWNSYMKDAGMGPRGMNSFNHYAYGCVCEWLWKTAAGIAADPARPGFRHIIMAPVPDPRLGHLKASYPSAAGLIKSEWRYDSDKTWTWHFTIPKGATATVTIPGESAQEYTAGTYTIRRQL